MAGSPGPAAEGTLGPGSIQAVGLLCSMASAALFLLSFAAHAPARRATAQADVALSSPPPGPPGPDGIVRSTRKPGAVDRGSYLGVGGECPLTGERAIRPANDLVGGVRSLQAVTGIRQSGALQ